MSNPQKTLDKAVTEAACNHKNTRKIVAAIILSGHLSRSLIYSRDSEENRDKLKKWVDWIMEEI